MIGIDSERLQHFPNSLFGASMGLFGTALAFRSAEFHLASVMTGWVAIAVFIALLTTYLHKARIHRQAVLAEWHHPVRMAFFPAISISLLLMATFLIPDLLSAANVIWLLGAVIQAFLTVSIVSVWIGARAFGPAQMSPAWFIPAVGNVLAPLAGVPLGYVELSWYFFSAGMLFWMVLLTLLFNRLMFHEPMPDRLQPTLVILMAPPAVGFLSWLALNGNAVGNVGRMLVNIGILFTLIVLAQGPRLLRLPFVLSFWALSFPVAAMTTACFRFAALEDSRVHAVLGHILLALLVIVVTTLVHKTVQAARRGQICVPE